MTTKHNCGGPVFGRKTAGCPRCDELIGGAAPIQWLIRKWAQDDYRRSEAIRNHDHVASNCGPVCTAFDW
jgi:hypothetical protein